MMKMMVMTYELQSDEHEEGVKEILDYWFGVLVCMPLDSSTV